MCACAWDYVCVGCRDTRWDPSYFDPANDEHGFDPYDLLAPPGGDSAEYQVLDG